ncbi:hypothetical protein [Parabacteroides sp. PF5-6]|uniref:hypothetical protein n=1 Tax=Parabacteroides sp. PF5-6 TaxID=1742403 RepID=UPI002406FCA5|nr:hypothetical protein [Parabacteroides sp. PF5-6]MDF9830148.1 ABC-type transporter MlaC component [Parabacteroides sp. PF5-6]
MKKVIFICALMVLGTVCMSAQGRGDMQQMMKERVENYVKELKLEGEKATKFREVQNASMEKMRKEMESMRDSGTMDRDAMREKMQKFNEERDAEVKKILSADEFKKYQDILSKEPRGPRN